MGIPFTYALYEDDQTYDLKRAHESDACYDLVARCFVTISGEEDHIVLQPGYRCLCKAGVFLKLPVVAEALVRPRSGNALKMGLTVLNSPGTIDSGYRGEVGAILYNADHSNPIVLKKGNKVAQLAIREVPALYDTRVSIHTFDGYSDRGADGFGSTGV